MTKEKCAVIDCTADIKSRGFCNRHYLAMWKRGLAAPLIEPTLEMRFWSKVNVRKAGQCWDWTGSRRKSGHGQFLSRGLSTTVAPAIALILTGTPRPKGQLALHHCDNPPCCNPNHLYFGTHQDNNNDAWSRERMPVGQDRHASILTNEQVLAIRKRSHEGELSKNLALEYGIHPTTISNIINGRRWKHLGGPTKGKNL